MTWHFHVTGTEGDPAVAVQGVPAWSAPWIPLDGEPADVRLPDGRDERFAVYAIETPGDAIVFAAGEVSPGVYAFFAERPPELELLWARDAFRVSMIRTTTLTAALTAAPLTLAGAIALWRDGAPGPALLIATLGALFIGDCVLAWRSTAWPWLWRTVLRLPAS